MKILKVQTKKKEDKQHEFTDVLSVKKLMRIVLEKQARLQMNYLQMLEFGMQKKCVCHLKHLGIGLFKWLVFSKPRGPRGGKIG
jgi:hypothetical protein